uniref:Purple acid phosphatase n=1 Tax=Timema genevievae TaxID=629358 RepID=A0A7R9JZW9_TIMGE|nr:unnamed protein product [Timema genevievae]
MVVKSGRGINIHFRRKELGTPPVLPTVVFPYLFFSSRQPIVVRSPTVLSTEELPYSVMVSVSLCVTCMRWYGRILDLRLREDEVQISARCSRVRFRTDCVICTRERVSDKATEMVVTWSTVNDTSHMVEGSWVEYGLDVLNLTANSSYSGTTSFRNQYIHRVKLTDLEPGSVYVYHCGSELGWSPVFWFKTRPAGQSWSPMLAVYGDLGNSYAESLTLLQKEAQRGLYDAFIHAGDFAVGDEFLRQIESIAGYVPYMTCPGNHEQANNFSDYRNRFSMPGDTEGLWYSFDVGPIHFISISTEVYYFLEYGFELTCKTIATLAENRALRPWIIVYGHRPMYCSNENTDDCTTNQTQTRTGFMELLGKGLEDLLYDYGVDLEIWAHEHSYERLWPIYNYQVYNGSLNSPYSNPEAPVHVVTGSAGCSEFHDPFKSEQPYWSAFRSSNYGYNRLKVFNSTHLYMEYVSVEHHGVSIAYHCGSEKGWSPVFWFKTRPPGQSWSPALAVYGDLGYHNARSLPLLQNEVQRGFYDAVIHAGDFAYDMNDEEGKVGDKFLRQIESMAGYIPYMTCPGNHEANNNFSDYRNRFSMPGDTEGLWYSFDVGPIHFISISTEVYYFLEYGFELLARQFNWLKEDLKKATKPSNRALRPWIIVYGHRPMYCSNKNTDYCTMNQTRTRIGTPDIMKLVLSNLHQKGHFWQLGNDGLEDMFYKHGVDLEIWAHEHSYERLWPIYNYQIYNGSLMEPYRNPGAPVHVITGSAGCDEKHDPFKSEQPYWSAFRSNDYGYTRLKVFNSTHLYMEYVSVEHHGKGKVIDQFWIIKDNHGPYFRERSNDIIREKIAMKTF